MPEENERPRFREHMREISGALSGLGKDVELDIADAPHRAKEGTKNAFARAAGIRKTPMHEWEAADGTDSK